jgi:hypothetical protein
MDTEQSTRCIKFLKKQYRMDYTIPVQTDCVFV